MLTEVNFQAMFEAQQAQARPRRQRRANGSGAVGTAG